MMHPLGEEEEEDAAADADLPAAADMNIDDACASDVFVAVGGVSAKWDGTGLPATIKQDPQYTLAFIMIPIPPDCLAPSCFFHPSHPSPLSPLPPRSSRPPSITLFGDVRWDTMILSRNYLPQSWAPLLLRCHRRWAMMLRCGSMAAARSRAKRRGSSSTAVAHCAPLASR